MTWTAEFFPFNALELGSLSVNQTADSGYPEARLFDRAISLYWKATLSGEFNFDLNQSGTVHPIDFLAIARHNLTGKTLNWLYSPTNDYSGDSNEATTPFSVADNNPIVKRIASPVTCQYWRVNGAALVNPQIGEIFMSRGFAFNCLRDSNPYGGDVDQVQWNQSLGGVERGSKLGAKKRVRNYTFMLSDTEFADFETVVGYLDDYSKPFFFKDHADNYFLARFDEMPSFDFNHNVYTRVGVRILEML